MDEELREKIGQIGKNLQEGKARIEEYRAMGDIMLAKISAEFDKAAGELISLLAEEATKAPEEPAKPLDTKKLENLNYRPPDCGCGD